MASEGRPRAMASEGAQALMNKFNQLFRARSRSRSSRRPAAPPHVPGVPEDRSRNGSESPVLPNLGPERSLRASVDQLSACGARVQTLVQDRSQSDDEHFLDSRVFQLICKDKKIEWLTARRVTLEQKNALSIQLIAKQEAEIRNLKNKNDTLKENNKFWRLLFKNLKEKYNLEEDGPPEPEDDSDEPDGSDDADDEAVADHSGH